MGTNVPPVAPPPHQINVDPIARALFEAHARALGSPTSKPWEHLSKEDADAWRVCAVAAVRTCTGHQALAYNLALTALGGELEDLRRQLDAIKESMLADIRGSIERLRDLNEAMLARMQPREGAPS